MPLDFILCTVENNELVLVKDAFDLDVLEPLIDDELSEETMVLLTLNTNVDSIVELGNDFLDMGKKNANGLYKLLSGKGALFPCLRTEYSTEGNLNRSVRNLIKQLELDNSRQNAKCYILGLSNDFFDSLISTIASVSKFTYHSVASARYPVKTAGAPKAAIELANSLSGTITVPDELHEKYIGSYIECNNARMLAMRAAKMAKPILLFGESGTGKSALASLIDKYSKPHVGKFVHVHLDMIDSEELESELFGHVKGAFRGATDDREGLWERARYGTLFLDEIGVLTLEQQKKVMRALKEGVIRRVGSHKDIKVTARVLTASNWNLFARVNEKKYREDLYDQILTFRIKLPALREHSYDIPLIAQKIWNDIVKSENDLGAYPLSKEFKLALREYAWPGNVHLLRSMLSHLYDLYEKKQPSAELLHLVMRRNGQLTLEEEINRSTPEDIISIHRSKCLEHLKSAVEVIRACEKTIHPMIYAGIRDGEDYEHVVYGLEQRYNELHDLCKKPDLFLNDILYDMLFSIKGRLKLYIGKLKADAEEAVSLWVKQAQPEILVVRQSLFATIKELMNDNE